MTGFYGGVGWGVTGTCDPLSAWMLWRTLPGLLGKEPFAVCSWASAVRWRFVLPVFYNCPGICRQWLLINVAVILSVTFPSILSESLYTSELTSTFLEACVCQTLSMGDLLPWGGIFQPWSGTGLFYDRIRVSLFIGSHISACLRLETPVLGCSVLPLQGNAGAAPLLFLSFSVPSLSSRFSFAPSFPLDLLPLECSEIPASLHLFSICSPPLPQPLSLHHFWQSQVSLTQFVPHGRIISGSGS